MKIAPLSLADETAWAALLAVSFTRELTQMQQLLRFLQAEQKLVAWGAWDGERLAAQYSCYLTAVSNPTYTQPIPVGMSINMAVHPDYRGRGLIKQVSQPVYAHLQKNGVLAGVGFSNAAGVQVDKKSKGYGYQVIGQLRPYLAILRQPSTCKPLTLTSTFPNKSFNISKNDQKFQFMATPQSICHRFAHHPFRQYQFAIWEEKETIRGVVIFRTVHLFGVRCIALLAAYSNKMAHLLQRWSKTMCQAGTRLVQFVTTPNASILDALKPTAHILPQPRSRNPYYLTLKPLSSALPTPILNYQNWDCVGGDIL